MTIEKFRDMLERGEISKFDIKEMLKTGVFTIDDIIDTLRKYAKFVRNIKDNLF